MDDQRTHARRRLKGAMTTVRWAVDVKKDEVQDNTSSSLPESEQEWKELIRSQMQTDRYYYIVLFLTVFVLLADDMRVAFFPKSTDPFIFAFMFICLLLFIAEICLLLWTEEYNGKSLYFWLDLIATIGIIPDIPWLAIGFIGALESATNLELSTARTSRIARIGARLGRLIRMTQFLRFVRTLKWLKYGHKKASQTKRKGQEELQETLSEGIMEIITQRIVLIVLTLVAGCFVCQPFVYDYSAWNGLKMLDSIAVDNISSYPEEYERVYEQTLNQSIATYIVKHTTTPGKRLLYLRVKNTTFFPVHQRPGYCCFDSWRDEFVNLDYFRAIEVLHYTVTSSSSQLTTEAYVDQTSALETEAMLDMLIIIALIWLMLYTAFSYSRHTAIVIKKPVQDLLAARQTMNAVLEVFNVVSHDSYQIDEMMDTMTAACCKAVEAERVNLWFVDSVGQKLSLRSSQTLDVTELLEMDERDELSIETAPPECKERRSSKNTQIRRNSKNLHGKSMQKVMSRRKSLGDSMNNIGEANQMETIDVTVKVGQGTIGVVAMTGRNKCLEDASDEKMPGNPHYKIRNEMVLAVNDPKNNEILAVIQCVNKSFLPCFQPNDMTVMESFCKQIGSLIKQHALSALYSNVLDDEKSDHALSEMLKGYQGIDEQSQHHEHAASTAESMQNHAAAQLPSSGDDDSVAWHLQTNLPWNTPEFCGTVKTFDYDTMEQELPILLKHTATMFGEMGLLRTFNINQNTLYNFVNAVHAGYDADVPFHNFDHAWSVFHACYLMMVETAAVDSLTMEDTIALFIAALAHDVGHKGLNNAFHMQFLTRKDEWIPELALRYNDISVLENYAAYSLFAILSNGNNCNVLEKMPLPQFSEVRTIIIKAILATDMAQHTQATAAFEEKNAFSVDSSEDRQVLVNTMLHAADLSNPCFTCDIAVKWALRVAKEFKRQTLMEHATGSRVTSFMDIHGQIDQENSEVNGS